VDAEEQCHKPDDFVQNSEESFREAEASASQAEALQLRELKLQPDSIARQPHASFTKKFTPDHRWHVLENFVKTHYRLFCIILPLVPDENSRADHPGWRARGFYRMSREHSWGGKSHAPCNARGHPQGTSATHGYPLKNRYKIHKASSVQNFHRAKTTAKQRRSSQLTNDLVVNQSGP
jgi:hypothetical protein